MTWQQVLCTLKQHWCGLRGHHFMLTFEPPKLSLRCSKCNYQSAGIIAGNPPEVMKRRVEEQL